MKEIETEIEKCFDKDEIYRSARKVIENGRTRKTEIVGELKCVEKIKNYLEQRKEETQVKIKERYLFKEFEEDKVKDKATLKVLKELVKYLEDQKGGLIKENKETIRNVEKANVVATKIAKEDLNAKIAERKLTRALNASKKAREEAEKANEKAKKLELRALEAKKKYEKLNVGFSSREDFDDLEKV